MSDNELSDKLANELFDDDELFASRRWDILLVRVFQRIDRLVKRIEELEKRMTDHENRVTKAGD